MSKIKKIKLFNYLDNLRLFKRRRKKGRRTYRPRRI